MKRNLCNMKDGKRVNSLLRAEKEGWRKERLIALRMGFSSSNTLETISGILGRDKATIQRWFTLYRRSGLEGLLNRTHKGRPYKHYTESIQQYLKKGLEQGKWNTAVQAQQDLKEHFKGTFKYTTVWCWLKKLAGVLRVPRPVHEKRDSSKAEAFKGNFYTKLESLKLSQNKPVRVWFADESRYGLRSLQRRCWTIRGLRQHKKYQSRYEWSYCYGALDVVEGKSIFIQTPTVNLEWTEAFLQQLKNQFPQEEHVVVWDGAGFHPKDSLHPKIPDGVHVLRLPPYSPELNPIEKLWDCIQDEIANKVWSSIENLDQTVASHLSNWWMNTEKVLSLVGNGWQHIQANASHNYHMRNLN